MLPKIAAAISQWILPIKTRQAEMGNGEGSGGNAYSKLQKNPEAEEEKKPEPLVPPTAQPQVKPHLTLVPNPYLEKQKEADVEKDAVFSFLRISNDSPIHRWFGAKDYQQGSKRQKKAARAKKGALVDKKI